MNIVVYSTSKNADQSAKKLCKSLEKIASYDDAKSMSDNTMTTEWATYRQAFRDVTSQEGFPFTVEWPVKPE